MNLWLRLFLPFAAGYYFSYFLRNVNAVIAPELTRELGVSAADLGLLTSAYLLAFGAVQLPLGLALDRYGPEAVLTRAEALGESLCEDHNIFCERVDATLREAGIKLPAADLKQILRAVSWRVETAPPVISKIHKPGKVKADPLHGFFEVVIDGRPAIVEYETDAELRDTEQVPLLEEGGIAAFIRREVLPYTPDAWIREDATRIGYEISFTRHFYKPQPLRTLEEISADILAIEKEAEGLLDGLLKGVAR